MTYDPKQRQTSRWQCVVAWAALLAGVASVWPLLFLFALNAWMSTDMPGVEPEQRTLSGWLAIVFLVATIAAPVVGTAIFRRLRPPRVAAQQGHAAGRSQATGG